ncbi:hypothetical protein EV424DRAFT_1112904 [Suillus variegatus]|nr:hypothetical protein EV424DRAFT_1112904 [Suillus variegatus]
MEGDGAPTIGYPDFAEDLRPYFAMDTSYDVIISHSFGCQVNLSLLPFLPKTKETTVILVDPPLEQTEAQVKMNHNLFLELTKNIKTAEEHMAENPAWSRRDCVLRALGVAMVDPNTVEVFRRNTSWSAIALKNVPPHVKITILVSDPKLSANCLLEHIPRDIERLDVKLLTGIGHWIQYECLDAIMDAIPLPRTKFSMHSRPWLDPLHASNYTPDRPECRLQEYAVGTIVNDPDTSSLILGSGLLFDA